MKLTIIFFLKKEQEQSLKRPASLCVAGLDAALRIRQEAEIATYWGQKQLLTANNIISLLVPLLRLV